MKKRNSRRITTIITIFAVMMLLIPAGALFADSIDGLPSGSGETTESIELAEAGETEELEPEESEETEEIEETDGEEASERAAFVAIRNTTAESLGIPSGHLNLIDKLAEISGSTRELLLPDWQDAEVQDIMKEISKWRFSIKGKEVPPGIAKHGPEETEEPMLGEEAGALESGNGKGKNKHN